MSTSDAEHVPRTPTDEVLGARGFDLTAPGIASIPDPHIRLRVLRAFLHEHADTAPLVVAAVASRDSTTSRELLHKLTGSTATIGLAALHRSVVALHRMLRDHPDDDPAPELAAFEADMDSALHAIRSLHEGA